MADTPPTSEQTTLRRSDCSTARPKEVILLIHGIRTFAWWQQMVKRVLEEIPNVEVLTPEYGYFDAIRFWCPLFTRKQPIKEVREEIQKARDSIRHDPDARLSVIAHSYGTYVITKLLSEDLDLRFHRLVLCGSIVPRGYRWHTLGHRYCFDGIKVINDYGTKDVWPVLAKCLSWGYGDTGRHKFGKQEVLDRAHPFAHSDFFKDEAGKGEGFVRTYWKPWFENGDFVASKWGEKASSPLWLSWLSVLPIQWMLTLMLAVVLCIGGYRGAVRLLSSPDQKTEDDIKVNELLAAIDHSQNGKELGFAVDQVGKSPVKDYLLKSLQEYTAASNINRLGALTLLKGCETSRIQEMCKNKDDRSEQTAVAALLAEVPGRYSPELEKRLLHALASEEPFGADYAYFLIICLAMAYQGDSPRLQPPPNGEFWQGILKHYQTHRDAGVHSSLRLLLTINSNDALDKVEQGLRESRTENAILLELKQAGKQGPYPTWFVTPSGSTMIVIPPGGFKVSVPKGWKSDSSSPIPINAQCQVDHWFAVSSLEVSNDEFSAYIKQLAPDNRAEVLKARNTYGGKVEPWIDTRRVPATRVSWFYATDYCTWLTDSEDGGDGVAQTSTRNRRRFTDHEPNLDAKNSTAYRLPLEEEWEYACRAGSSTSRFFGEDAKFLNAFAWFGTRAEEAGTGEAVPQPVGLKLPNRWGLFDVYGNADEWCMNIWRDDFTSDHSGVWTPYRGTPSLALFERPVRGGNCGGSGQSLFSSYRQKTPEDRNHAPKYGGFRVARTFFISARSP